MGKCDWCGHESDNLIKHMDAIGDAYNICEECNKKVVLGCACRKCGNVGDPSMMVNGLCVSCVQVEMVNKSKKQEDARRGLGLDVIHEIYERQGGEVELTDEDYEQWMTFRVRPSAPKLDIMKSMELKRLWILIKLNATGVYDTDVIADNFKNIEALLDRNFTKLIGNRCRIIIADTPEMRKVVRESEVIDYNDKVYIIKMASLD